MPFYNAVTQNNRVIKGSHKYDAYLRDEKKKNISTDQVKTAFRFSLDATWSNAPTTSMKERYVTPSGVMLKRRHVNKQQDDFSSVLQ